MSIRKRNEFLDLDESENEGSDGYQSDVLEESKGARTTKRRKVDHSEDEDSDEDLDEPAEAPATKTPQTDARFAKLQEFEEDGEDAPGAEDEEDGTEDALDEELVDDTTTTGRNEAFSEPRKPQEKAASCTYRECRLS
jgi:ESF2/ABP1 family protein